MRQDRHALRLTSILGTNVLSVYRSPSPDSLAALRLLFCASIAADISSEVIPSASSIPRFLAYNSCLSVGLVAACALQQPEQTIWSFNTLGFMREVIAFPHFAQISSAHFAIPASRAIRCSPSEFNRSSNSYSDDHNTRVGAVIMRLH
jgi:hypothetical protein